MEISAGCIVAGVDEAGVGSWAGPVVAAAVIINHKCVPAGINDSKKLPAPAREKLYDEIVRTSHTGIGIGTVEEIYMHNILEATKLAMQRAVAMLGNNIELALIDGNRLPALYCRAQAIIGGDAKSLSIAAASIIAKVTRDRIMRKLAEKHPAYGWERNAGYGTKYHQESLCRHGVTEHHRKGYRPIREILDGLKQAV